MTVVPDMSLTDIVDARRGAQWCLFLDRDGVVNRRIVDDYVRSWDAFDWLPGARSGLGVLSGWAPHLVVVTNQQGIGKKVMSRHAVDDIHRRVQTVLQRDGVAVEAFIVCPHLASQGCGCRKPRPGMVLEWLETHPQVEAALSVVVGDSASDIKLAHNVRAAVGGCAAIHVGTEDFPDLDVDARFESLQAFATAVTIAGGQRIA